jgi:hypothetical protein
MTDKAGTDVDNTVSRKYSQQKIQSAENTVSRKYNQRKHCLRLKFRSVRQNAYRNLG